MNKISILGCGWIGFHLASELLQQDYCIKGSSASKDKVHVLAGKGIHAYYIKVNKDDITGENLNSFFSTDILILSIPPKRIEKIEEIFPMQVKQIINRIVVYKYCL